ncbi:MAG: divergent polysaccharide deacetylase family protein [Campylobacterota bacterium]|nr:divergent polysaccharide deacetylase family protein [Campylobacterota bacterium]
MAPQSSKRSTKKTNQKVPSKKAGTRKTVSRKKKKGSRTRRDILIALLLMVLVVIGGAGYYFGQHTMSQTAEKENPYKPMALVLNDKIPVKTTASAESKKVVAEEDDLGAIGELIREQHKAKAKKSAEKNESKAMETAKLSKPVKTVGIPVKAPVTNKKSRARLVIIIDDVATPGQLKRILAVPIKLTPSIFPPSKRLRSTAKMAKNLKHYMIHFPMEAGNYPKYAMFNTLRVNDTEEKMRSRVKDLRKWFPSCVYINNHTGSVFTSDYRALHTVYGILKEEGFIFVDSRTSSKTKGKKVARAYGDFYLHRDVFIDNVQEFAAIRKQLKLAVKKAKKQGYAVAIGHPHSMTFKTLKNSEDILSAVDVVYLDELLRH